MKKIPAALLFRKFRERNYLTQEGLAREMGTCLRTILNVENATSEPSKRTWEKFKLAQTRARRRKWDAKRREQKKLAQLEERV